MQTKEHIALMIVLYIHVPIKIYQKWTLFVLQIFKSPAKNFEEATIQILVSM